MLNRDKRSISFSPFLGPDFGCDDFGFQSNLKKGFVYANNHCNFLSNNNLELIDEKGNKKYFETKELEIFKIVF